MRKEIAQKISEFPSENLRYCVLVSRGKQIWQFNYTSYDLASEQYQKQMYEEANMCSICGGKSIIGLYAFRVSNSEFVCQKQIVISGLKNNYK